MWCTHGFAGVDKLDSSGTLFNVSVLHCLAKTAQTLLCSLNVEILQGFGLHFREKLKGEWNLPQAPVAPWSC